MEFRMNKWPKGNRLRLNFGIEEPSNPDDNETEDNKEDGEWCQGAQQAAARYPICNINRIDDDESQNRFDWSVKIQKFFHTHGYFCTNQIFFVNTTLPFIIWSRREKLYMDKISVLRRMILRIPKLKVPFLHPTTRRMWNKMTQPPQPLKYKLHDKPVEMPLKPLGTKEELPFFVNFSFRKGSKVWLCVCE